MDNEANIREVKDTVEDEIADACIRLLDLIGSKAKENEDMGVIYVCPSYYKKTLTHMLFRVCKTIGGDNPLNYPLSILKAVAEHYKFDLMAHIRLKLKYNETRPALHGKKY